MSNFKVGDKVVRTGCSLFWHGILKGGIYTVSVQHHSHVQLAETTGYPEALFDADLFRLAKYSEYFTEQVPSEQAKGHVADSPIQKHSVGEFYPLAVVGYGQGSIVTYVVENLAQQTVAGWGSEAVRQWASSEDAASFAARVKSGDIYHPALKWFGARPVFTGPNSNHLVLPPAPAKRTRVVFEKQDDIIEINGAYYKALEQDIG